MKISTMHLGKLKDISRERERENESRRLKQLKKRLQTIIREREQGTAQKVA